MPPSTRKLNRRIFQRCRRTLYRYNALGRLTETIDSLNNRTQQTWDAHGQVTSVTVAAGNPA